MTKDADKPADNRSNVMTFPPAIKEKAKSESIHARSVLETRLLTTDDLEQWKRPRFQRPIRINNKVIESAEELKQNGGIIPGIICLGLLPGDNTLWIVDGSHRIEMAKMTGLSEFIAEVRITHFNSLAEMADEFVRLNSSLVKMRSEDILRGLEENTPMMQLLRKQCSFVGYDNIRRGSTTSCVVGMSAVLRCWAGSCSETPTSSNTPAVTLAENLTEIDVQNLSLFLNAAYAAWRNEPEYFRLWSNLNLVMCMWLFNQMVLRPASSTKDRRSTSISLAQFNKCLMSVSADTAYIEWLVGRNINERDRNPCYKRLRQIFFRRLTDDGMSPPKFPTPSWYTKS